MTELIIKLEFYIICLCWATAGSPFYSEREREKREAASLAEQREQQRERERERERDFDRAAPAEQQHSRQQTADSRVVN